MLLNSGFQQEAPSHASQPLPYNTVESLLDDVSKQMASSNLARRYSRGANGQRLGGGSMRVVKPSSTSNSPRGSATINRRKTVMGGGPYRSRPMVMDQSTTSGPLTSTESLQVPTRSSRPVSWHPSTHIPSQTGFQYPSMTMTNGYGGYELPMTPAVYSGYTSPASTFSPVSLPYTGYDQYPFPEDTTYFPSLDHNNNVYAPYQPSTLRQQEGSPQQFHNGGMEDASMYTHFEWANFVANGFSNTTAPPTPENFLPIQHPEATFEVEEAIPYEPLDDEETGEELIGMGLYDTPEKSASMDPQLDNYRNLMMQSLLGGGYRKPDSPVESSGKGLKLEETWVPPPASEDGEGDDNDEDEDDETDAHGSPVEDTVTEFDNDDSILAKFAGAGLSTTNNSWQTTI